jgi:hypothetical protein
VDGVLQNTQGGSKAFLRTYPDYYDDRKWYYGFGVLVLLPCLALNYKRVFVNSIPDIFSVTVSSARFLFCCLDLAVAVAMSYVPMYVMRAYVWATTNSIRQLPDIELDIERRSKEMSVDRELLGEMIKLSQGVPRTTKTLSELYRKGNQWISRYRKHWASHVVVQQLDRCVPAAFASNYEQVALEFFTSKHSQTWFARMWSMFSSGDVSEGMDGSAKIPQH